MVTAVHNVSVGLSTGVSFDRRYEERYEIPLDAKLDIIGSDLRVIARTPALVINISRTGACLITDLSVKPENLVVLQLVHEQFYTSAAVVGVVPAGAAVQRVHIQFLGNQWAPAKNQQ